MYILGISAFYHDSAAAIIYNGQILAAAQEERFSRKKHDASFPTSAVQYCLDHVGIRLDQVEAIAFYDKPFLKFERLLETYYAFAPSGIRSFIKAMPVWIREKLFLKRQIYKELEAIGEIDKRKLPLLFPEHHLSHAASAFYPSPFSEAAVLTVDGVGEWATASIAHGKGKSLKNLRELHFPHSIGLLYSAFTYYLGFRVNSGEYKLMGLAPYGDPESEEVTRFRQLIKTELTDIKEDGSIWLNQAYFSYATGLRMAKDKKWKQLFGFPRREPEQAIEPIHCNLALAIQLVTEEVVIKMAGEARRLTGSKNLCLAGGVALNCVANGKLLSAGIFDQIYIQPASGDAGGAPGAAWAAWHIYYDKDRLVQQPDAMQDSLLGPEYSATEIARTIRRYEAVAEEYGDFEALCKETARLLADGKVVGWMQGRMEFGPRALGARSILGDPRSPEMQKKLNLKIKYRESFRPFAPSVLADRAGDYFDLDAPSPYMLLVRPVRKDLLRPLPADYHQRSLKDKLYFQRSSLPAITHIDFSARIQTVAPEGNYRYWQLLSAFDQETGCAILVNTSFNVRGEPIVCTPEDAYRCFMRTEMDFLVIGNFLFSKDQQPDFKGKKEFKEEFVLD